MAARGIYSQPGDPELRRRENQENEHIEKFFPEWTRFWLAKFQLFFSAVLLQVILVAIDDGWHIALAGIGICSALCFGITGGVGLVTLTTQRSSRRSIKIFGVLSIVCAIFAVTLIAICVAGIRQSYRDGQPGKSFLFCLTFLTGFAETIVAIVTASHSCRVGPLFCTETTIAPQDSRGQSRNTNTDAPPSYETSMTN